MVYVRFSFRVVRSNKHNRLLFLDTFTPTLLFFSSHSCTCFHFFVTFIALAGLGRRRRTEGEKIESNQNSLKVLHTFFGGHSIFLLRRLSKKLLTAFFSRDQEKSGYNKCEKSSKREPPETLGRPFFHSHKFRIGKRPILSFTFFSLIFLKRRNQENSAEAKNQS